MAENNIHSAERFAAFSPCYIASSKSGHL